MTAAQLFTKEAYHGDKTSTLHYKVMCHDLNDLLESVKIIEAYNEFNHALVVGAFQEHASRKDDRGNDMYRFIIGREYSPVIYVEYFSMTHSDKDRQSFKDSMELIKRITWADELSIEEGTLGLLKARFWWD